VQKRWAELDDVIAVVTSYARGFMDELPTQYADPPMGVARGVPVAMATGRCCY